MNDSFIMEHVHSPQQISRVASDHVLRKALLGYGPQSAFMTVLHEDVKLHLRGQRGEKGRERGRERGEKGRDRGERGGREGGERER